MSAGRKKAPVGDLLPPGTMKAAMFAILVLSAIALWLYTQAIFAQVRTFQKAVVQAQVRIYLSIIDPNAPLDTGLSSMLFESVILKPPYPIVFTDENMQPLPTLWHNVGIAADDTTQAAMNRLERLVRAMDSVNPPEPIPMPGLKTVADTLVISELAPRGDFPVIVTDGGGQVLASRNITVDPADTAAVTSALALLDTRSRPLLFTREGRPSLVFHGIRSGPWPIIVEDSNGAILYWSGIVNTAPDSASVRRGFAAIERSGVLESSTYPLVVKRTIQIENTWYFHYGDLQFLTLIGWLPVIEFAVLFILLIVGFVGFLNIKNAEQHSIWVGMAKEAAHQLGTPISSLSGWLELLRSEKSPEMLDQALPEIEEDIERLSLVAARFSRIGSKPELKPIELSDVLDEVLDYFRARAPRMGKRVEICGDYTNLRPVWGNPELLDWAFENLVKNSLSAIENGEGRIVVTASMTKDLGHVVVDVSDNGRGIPPRDQKKVMQPGFTTKKRGWGLGLSLVKRIVEEYHEGSFTLVESRPGEATTFRVVVHVAENQEKVHDET